MVILLRRQYHRLQYWFTKYITIPQKILNYDLIPDFSDRTFIQNSKFCQIHLSIETSLAHHILWWLPLLVRYVGNILG